MELEEEDPQARRTANYFLELYEVYEGWQLANQTKGPGKPRFILNSMAKSSCYFKQMRCIDITLLM